MRSNPAALTRAWGPLLLEAAKVAVTNRVVSTLIGTLSFILPVAVTATAGFSIESQTAILQRVDDVGSRIVTVVATGEGASIPSEAVDRISRLAGVAWVVGLGPVSDVHNRQPAGTLTPMRPFYAVRAPVVFSTNRAGGGYVSLVSARRAGLMGAYSTLDPDSIPIVGWFRTNHPLSMLEDFVLVPIENQDQVLERIIVAINDVGWVESVARSLPSMLGTSAAQASTIERSPQLLAAREAVRDEVASRDRIMVVGLLVIATLVAAVVVFAGTISARRDFGRRRALGATRPQLICLVIVSTTLPASVGALLGAIFGWLYLAVQLGHWADPAFTVSVGVLTVLALAAASAGPALVAATRDPLKVLRVP